MRLTCPNCAVQYEVDPELIAEDGRDVQCSACGHVWVQFRDGRRAAISADTAPVPQTADDRRDAAPAPDAASEPAAEPDPPRRELDETTRRILREEAEREAAQRRARRAQAAPSPSPPPPGADAVDEPGSEARPDAGRDAPRRRRTRLDAERAAAARGDLLPDIEEINSSLGAGTIRPHAPPRPRGFRAGFALVVIPVAILLAAYLAAPHLARAVPATGPLLASYVDGVNVLRRGVDAGLQSAADAIRDTAF